MAVSFYDAISLFRASQTGRGSRGTGRQRALARQVVTKMWQLFGEDEIEFDRLPAETLGQAPDRWLRHDVELNQTLRNDVAGTSVILVHETLHTVIDRHLLDEEMEARGLELLYYTELLPPGVSYYSHGQRREGHLTVGSLVERDLSAQAHWAGRDQLIDAVIAASESYWGSLTADWVARNIRNWGNLSNRWATSKGHFIRVLATEGRDTNGQLIVEIMESVNEQAHWREMMRCAGGESVVREALQASSLLYSTEPTEHVRRLQQRWGARLGAH